MVFHMISSTVLGLMIAKTTKFQQDWTDHLRQIRTSWLGRMLPSMYLYLTIKVIICKVLKVKNNLVGLYINIDTVIVYLSLKKLTHQKFCMHIWLLKFIFWKLSFESTRVAFLPWKKSIIFVETGEKMFFSGKNWKK